jgi:hypothetical protein
LSDSRTLEQQQADYRKLIPLAPAEDLLKLLEKAYWLLAQRALTAGFGVHDDNQIVDQQYRLTTNAVEQELLKRLHSGMPDGR